MNTITLGRRPTLGEVIEYYTQDSFLRYLLDTVRQRRVVIIISERKHWEPNWEKDEVVAQDTTDLRQFIERKIEACLPGAETDERPEFYPAFHQSVWKGPGGDGPNAYDQHMDCIFEADLSLWRDAFQDVKAVTSLLDRYHIPYQHKFSGHRSLHIVIPGEIMPQGYRGKATRKLASELLRWSGSQAHHLPKITRMPYSLNEDTGLVCLPIEHGSLPSFRPWQANLHLVDVPPTTWDLPTREGDQERLAALLRDLTAGTAPHRVAPDRSVHAIAGREDIIDRFRTRLGQLEGDGPVGRARERLASDDRMTSSDLIAGLSQSDPDATWLSAEAYLFHGTDMTPEIFDLLIAQNEEYTQASAIDALLRFEDAICPLVAEAISNLGAYSSSGARAAYLLTQSVGLREGVLDALMAGADETHEARITVACLTGAMSNDWASAMQLVAPVRSDHDLPPQERARLRRRLQALEIMGTLGGWNRVEEAQKARKLTALGPGITDLLLIAASSPERRFRREIVSALAILADPRATDLLILALNDDYTKVRQKAIRGLIRIGKPAMPALLAAADSDQVRIRRYAILCLGQIAAAQAEVATLAKPAIAEALRDSEQDVRRTALRAMAKLATPTDLDTLIAYMKDASPDDGIEAAKAIEGLDMAGSEALQRMAITERIPAAAFIIARQGDPRGAEILVEQLTTIETRDAAVDYLRELRDPRCVPYLVEQVRDATDWRGTWLAQELGAVGGEVAVRALIETLLRDVATMRRGAVRGLDVARDPVAIPALIDALADPDRKVRKLAAETLEHFGAMAVQPLREALTAVDPRDGRRRSIVLQMLNRLESRLGAR